MLYNSLFLMKYTLSGEGFKLSATKLYTLSNLGYVGDI